MHSLSSNYNKKSITLAYTFWLLTGLFGVHRFYLNAIRSGIVQFLILGVNFIFFAYAIYYIAQHYPESDIPDNETYMESIFFIIGFLLLIQITWLIIDLFWIYFTIRKEKQKHEDTLKQIKAFE